MATEFGLEILDKVQKEFATKIANDSKIKRLTKAIADGSKSYEEANEYAIRCGELLSQSITKYVNSGKLNYISRELAEDIIRPSLTVDYELIANAVKTVQNNMNKASNIGLEAQIADLNTNRIDGFIEKLASYDTLKEGEWLLDEPIVNYSQAVVDDSERKNMNVLAKAGMEPKITRKAEAPQTKTKTYKRGKRSITRTWHSPCEWCKNLEGTYLYKDVIATGSAVYRRHESCRCIVTFENGKKRQDVWKKTEWEVEEEKYRIEKLENAIAEKEKNKQVNTDKLEALEVISRKKDYVYSQTVEEAEEYAKQFLVKNGNVNYKGLTVDSANKINKALTEVLSVFKPDEKLNVIEPMNKRKKEFKDTTASAAYQWFRRNIFFNKDYYKSEKAIGEKIKTYAENIQKVLDNKDLLLEKNKNNKQKLSYLEALINTKRTTTSETDLYGSMVHELGHYLDDEIFRKKFKEKGFDIGKSFANYSKNISAYATTTNQEYVAESFAAFWNKEIDILDPELVKIFVEVANG